MPDQRTVAHAGHVTNQSLASRGGFPGIVALQRDIVQISVAQIERHRALDGSLGLLVRQIQQNLLPSALVLNNGGDTSWVRPNRYSCIIPTGMLVQYGGERDRESTHPCKMLRIIITTTTFFGVRIGCCVIIFLFEELLLYFVLSETRNSGFQVRSTQGAFCTRRVHTEPSVKQTTRNLMYQKSYIHT